MYLQLFHGRVDRDQNTGDFGWGFEGPTIGPLQRCHTTYDDGPRLSSKGWGKEFWLAKEGDMIHLGAGYYGDWSVVADLDGEQPERVVDLATAEKWANYTRKKKENPKARPPKHECLFGDVYVDGTESNEFGPETKEVCCLCGKAKE